MDPVWLHLLVFIFGYVTCQTFYFIKSTRVSLKLMKSSRIIYLLMMAKAIEKYKIAEGVMMAHLKESGQDERVIESFVRGMEEETNAFKSKSINQLISDTPSTFRDILGFHDWNSAMEYLLTHQDEAFKFWRLKE